MRVSPAVDQIGTGVDALASLDVAALEDTALREQLLALTSLSNRLHAEPVRRVDVFDRRGLAEADGFRTANTWLQAFARGAGHRGAAVGESRSAAAAAAQTRRRRPVRGGAGRACAAGGRVGRPGGWRIDPDTNTGEVNIIRPEGIPYPHPSHTIPIMERIDHASRVGETWSISTTRLNIRVPRKRDFPLMVVACVSK